MPLAWIVFIVAVLIIFPLASRFDTWCGEALVGNTREAKRREREIVALTIVRDELDEQIHERLQNTNAFTRRRIQRKLGKE